jgi:hypothetical protein
MMGNGVWPAVPVVSGMALVALGATQVTIERFRCRPHGFLVVGLNLAVYCGLYAVFVGASLHLAEMSAGHHLRAAGAIDLAASALVILATLAAAGQALRPPDTMG